MKKLFHKICSFGGGLPLLFLLPYAVTFFLNGGNKALLLYPVNEEKFVPLMLMVQMKGDYEPETVKAQAVIARSELYRRKKEESLFLFYRRRKTPQNYSGWKMRKNCSCTGRLWKRQRIRFLPGRDN